MATSIHRNIDKTSKLVFDGPIKIESHCRCKIHRYIEYSKRCFRLIDVSLPTLVIPVRTFFRIVVQRSGFVTTYRRLHGERRRESDIFQRRVVAPSSLHPGPPCRIVRTLQRQRSGGESSFFLPWTFRWKTRANQGGTSHRTRSDRIRFSKMVLQYTSTAVDPPVTLLRGVDSHENDELIENMLPEDVWFHVDNLSSAHVYLRLKEGETINDIPKALLEDACQLVKANSIQGCKLAEVKVVYTMWSNLKKLPGMKPGEVAFHNPNSVIKVNVKKEKTIVNRLNKTEKSIVVDYEGDRADRDRREIERKKSEKKIQLENKKEEDRKKREAAELRSYSSLMKSENMTANTDYSGYDSDSFM